MARTRLRSGELSPRRPSVRGNSSAWTGDTGSRPTHRPTFLKVRYRGSGWDCVDTPPASGESPVGTVYINRRCIKLVKGEVRAVLETKFLRKPGQAEFSTSGKLTIGQFESSTRLELLRSDIPPE